MGEQQPMSRVKKQAINKSLPKHWPWFKIILLIFLLLFVFFFHSTIHQLHGIVAKTYESSNIKHQRSLSTLLKKKQPVNILLMGTDTGELGRTDRGRTDSIMLLTLNPQKEQVTLISIPRDIMISIVGYEKYFPQKLNAAYAFGSTGATIKTMEAYLNVPIDGYALVNMGGLEKMVNNVGGIKIKSPLSFRYSQETAHDHGPNLYRFHKDSSNYEHSDDDGKTWSATRTSLTGDAALAFSRMRYDDPNGDYGRQQRQRIVLEALLKQATRPNVVFNQKMMDSLSQSIRTDITFNQLLYLLQGYGTTKNNIQTEHMQGKTDAFQSGDTMVNYEKVPESEKERITNVIRKQLNLSPAETGTTYGGQLPSQQPKTMVTSKKKS
ncbi:LCP family protein [Convivina praedatoris]|uniref:Polyisoprenyl-teichoic acid--peptidoglycan teichoic acid transferase TagU n=1 Tax=Convivina praedatoris TaxID=2880963 RepID=A0ABN8HC12_9LACO|nr:LCP family protein [Convivina sp. LMG 32447]CAH1851564.1 Polyisoprenyl-teichoic acid--peptidoglycan teichoic acid transferase TagU [Convivina sp. LMG 32447]CAH1851588.1 Polyisoprenyl-teichoic acid--peptidoglycan teichoic acid transferase TagU [Convivina sp. LMG 32447]CAH1853204.1 Polyisoprenyl-teichoic acid--peptidoglycan teichoic acid transferase TagU [Convivina sp. LMG 32447]